MLLKSRFYLFSKGDECRDDKRSDHIFYDGASRKKFQALVSS